MCSFPFFFFIYRFLYGFKFPLFFLSTYPVVSFLSPKYVFSFLKKHQTVFLSVHTIFCFHWQYMRDAVASLYVIVAFYFQCLIMYVVISHCILISFPNS